ncbi:GTP cyclohydrolase II [Saccharomycopsis crataegensis]|uniref:GTP cyclohydrolase II n=1 Tax=Saccharomycopsis crataegensis TaxID=43959 RepID=A0AAV5QJB8_9ASCO|nr:GTP cyclohydrolase II [Saccharomycopsis crataegensis]
MSSPNNIPSESQNIAQPTPLRKLSISINQNSTSTPPPKEDNNNTVNSAKDNTTTNTTNNMISAQPSYNKYLFENLSLVSPAVTPSPSTPKSIPVIPTNEFLNNNERNSLPDELPQVVCVARARIPTTNGQEIFLHLYSNNIDNKEHLAIVFGENVRSKTLFKKYPHETQSDRMTRGAYIGKLYPGRNTADKDPKTGEELHFDINGELIYDNQHSVCPESEESTLVRIHSECYTGETAWSARCDCGEQFDEAGRLMGKAGRGCIVYLRQEGRGIGLGEKLKAYNLQDLGADTVQANLLLRHPADARSFSLATAILADLNLTNIKLLTNNPDKIIAVEGKNRLIKVTERVPMVPLAWNGPHAHGIKSKEIDGYLRTKIEKMGHLLQKPINISNHS